MFSGDEVRRSSNISRIEYTVAWLYPSLSEEAVEKYYW